MQALISKGIPFQVMKLQLAPNVCCVPIPVRLSHSDPQECPCD